ncbi:MAG TPA: 7-cyano-7-deazaguanine synthase [Acidobacteriaceae bacterium]|nr:7-cyano-7-deazaguanine synthase [Acidobacteriaceae bacterium]
MNASTVVADDCLTHPPRDAIALRRRASRYGERNFIFDPEAAVNGLRRPLTPVEHDWLEILAALYAADKLCPRGSDIDYNRHIVLHLPVREPSHWTPFTQRIERLYGELTLDRLSLHLLQADSPITWRPKSKPFESFDSVALFSGGVDSFAGAVILSAAGRTPLLVSHAASGAIDRALKDLAPAATPGYGVSPRRVLARVLGAEVEGSERSRSMLYMGVASAIAAVQQVDEVYLNENGIMALHVPIAVSRAGSFSTKTANPLIMRDMAILASDALGAQVNIRNNLLAMTKPEVVDRLGHVAPAAAALLDRTISCFSIGRNGRHCGWCIPCLIRRVSFEFARVSDAEYLHDPWDSKPHNAGSEDNLGQLLTFAQTVSRAPDAFLERRYCEMHNTGPDLTVGESYAMHRRWANQVLAVATSHTYSRGLLP